MATGTIKNQHTGTWTSVNTNLKYQVRSGIVFVWIKHTGTVSSWTTIGTLPSAYAPDVNVYHCAYATTSGGGTFYIRSDGEVQYYGVSSTLETIITYPLP